MTTFEMLQRINQIKQYLPPETVDVMRLQNAYEQMWLIAKKTKLLYDAHVREKQMREVIIKYDIKDVYRREV